MRRKFPLYIYIGALFLSLVLATAGVVILVEYRLTKNIVLSDSSTVFQQIGGETRDSVELAYDRAILAVDLMATGRLAASTNLDERLKSLPFVLETLRADPDLSAAYVGYADGEMFLVRRMGPRIVIAANVAPPKDAAFVVQSLDHDPDGTLTGKVLFYTSDGHQIEVVPAPDYKYDPRTRPWYHSAQKGPEVQTVPPYIFYSTREVGASFVRRTADGSAVAAVDVTLNAFSEILQRVRPSASAEMMIFNDNGEILSDLSGTPAVKVDASGAAHLPLVVDLQRPALTALLNQERDGTLGTGTVEVAGTPWQSFVSRFDLPGEPFYFAMAVPQAELLIQTRKARDFGVLVALLAVVPLLPLAMAASQLASRPLRALTHEAHLIQRLKFDETAAHDSPISEISVLTQGIAAMKATIRQFLEIGAVLASERNFDRLLDRILVETARVAAARGGTIYLAEPDGRLTAAVAKFDDAPLDQPDLDPHDDADHPAMRSAAGESFTVPLGLAEIDRWYPNFGHRASLLLLSVPLRDRSGGLVGVLVLFQDTARVADATERDIMAVVEAVSGNAAVAIETRRLIEEQKQLLAAVIELIGGAIDAKSPYTGLHCQRVPELAKMIAAAAVETTQAPFAAFSLDEYQWEELHVAAWLHDCGKILTPEYVVDKATKLETIYDRLHEVRMRFEVIKREAEIACWKSIADGAERAERLAELAATWRVLDQEFAFIASINVGGEFLSPERAARIQRIAERRWTRTLDDRIGLSQEEQKRKNAQPAPALPVVEPLLADRPDHIIERSERQAIPADNPWGIRMAVPERLYNRGELYNLLIQRGTLTPEERFKINEHVIDTIRMLGRLPLPRHLQNIVEIAGGHHEKIDGTGYPKKLTGGEMSLQAKIMAVADIFEALTASDRPYRKPMRLSEAVAILARMCKSGELDPDVFTLFLSSGVYRDYAERHLSPEQLDTVDIDIYLETRAAA